MSQDIERDTESQREDEETSIYGGTAPFTLDDGWRLLSEEEVAQIDWTDWKIDESRQGVSTP